MKNMNKIILHDCKGQEILICAESIEALMSCNNGGDILVYLEDYKNPIRAFKMSQVVKDIEGALNKTLLKSKGGHYDNTLASDYDYFVPDKIKYIEPHNQDGYTSKIIVSSGRCWWTKNTIEELNRQLDNIFSDRIIFND